MLKEIILISLIFLLNSFNLQAQDFDSHPNSFREWKLPKIVDGKKVLPVIPDSVRAVNKLPITTNTRLIKVRAREVMDSTRVVSKQPVRLHKITKGNWKKIYTSEIRKQ